jgi:hypothetical protein
MGTAAAVAAVGAVPLQEVLSDVTPCRLTEVMKEKLGRQGS